MDKIAFISGDTFVFWSPIVLGLASLAAIAVYAALYLKKGGGTVALSLSIFLSLVLGLPISRLIHWYLRSDAYKSIQEAFTNFSVGGYALMGMFFGCLLSALVLHLAGISRNLPKMLDCMSIGGGFGIALGRLASLFNASDRGMILPEHIGFPFSYPVINSVSGAAENRLATFMIQSSLTAVIVVLLCLYMALAAWKRRPIKDGDIFLLFMMTYGASQILCDSTRYDSLFFPANRFISVVQILGLLILLVPIGIFSFRAVKTDKLRPKYIFVWLGILLFGVAAGFCEYFVQRRSDAAVLCYSIMGVSLLVMIFLGLLLRQFANHNETLSKT